MKHAVFGLLVSLVFATACAGQSLLKGVDMYRNDQITTAQLQRAYGEQLDSLVRLLDQENIERFGSLKQEIEAGVHRLGDFAFVNIAILRYFEEGQDPYYVTFDVVDAADGEKRIPFRDAPEASFDDPDSLFGYWDRYSETALDLVQRDELKPAVENCPALHCTFGFEHPALERYADLFNTRAPKNKETLVDILYRDRDEEHRAKAALLLAHTEDVREVADHMLRAMSDPSSAVRNNAMRVLAYLTSAPRNVDVLVEPFIEAIDFPSTTDRNKALAVLNNLAARPGNKTEIAQQAAARLVALLRLEQPNNHQFAYFILKQVSGEAYGERDYASWERWASNQAR